MNTPTPFQRLDTSEQAALIECCERILAAILLMRLREAQRRTAVLDNSN